MTKRVNFTQGSWAQLELLPRIRVQMTDGGLGLGLAWLPWWLHFWLWLKPSPPPAPPIPTDQRWYVCNDSDCAWAGRLSETVHPKHVTEFFTLCPDCHETVEWYEPHEYMPQNPGFAPERFAAKECHECGLPDLHEIHAESSANSTGD